MADDFGFFSSSESGAAEAPEEDPAAAFLAQQESEIAGIENDEGFSTAEGAPGGGTQETGEPLGECEGQGAPPGRGKRAGAYGDGRRQPGWPQASRAAGGPRHGVRGGGGRLCLAPVRSGDIGRERLESGMGREPPFRSRLPEDISSGSEQGPRVT